MNAIDSFDISTSAVLDTTVVELVDPKGEPMVNPKTKEPCTITVFGPGSKEFQKAQATRNRAVVETVRRGTRRMKDSEQREVDAAFLATCTASFNGFHYKGMTGYEQFKSAYMDSGIGYIAEQVNKVLSDWGAFTKPASTT